MATQGRRFWLYGGEAFAYPLPVFGFYDNITLHYIKTLYSGLNKSNFKDHYAMSPI